ncbi:MAG TPA: PGPGW domain-containing protein [Marmoricola sp.]
MPSSPAAEPHFGPHGAPEPTPGAAEDTGDLEHALAAARTREEDEQHWWDRVNAYLHRNKAMSATTKLVVTLLGSAVLMAGLVMMVTPGPGLLGIVAGLAILATEWDWADRWLTTARRKLHEARLAAEAMDPRVRRRRVLLTTAGVVAAVVAATTYVLLQDWPGWSVSVWDQAQSFIGFLPELPGMDD